MSKLVITGGVDFIGLHIAESHVKNSHKLVTADNLDPYYFIDFNKRNLDLILKSRYLTFINFNVTDLKPDYVNILSTLNVFNASLGAEIKKAVNAPSSSVMVKLSICNSMDSILQSLFLHMGK
ncbi:MAG: UDP-glucose 4-epimerase [Euryarchaeota archaeon]|nr:UDP-glucose 4-epimerase [Euryarchaeota archaeon]